MDIWIHIYIYITKYFLIRNYVIYKVFWSYHLMVFRIKQILKKAIDKKVSHCRSLDLIIRDINMSKLIVDTFLEIDTK